MPKTKQIGVSLKRQSYADHNVRYRITNVRGAVKFKIGGRVFRSGDILDEKTAETLCSMDGYAVSAGKPTI